MDKCCRNCLYYNSHKGGICTVLPLGLVRDISIPAALLDIYFCKEYTINNEMTGKKLQSLLENTNKYINEVTNDEE